MKLISPILCKYHIFSALQVEPTSLELARYGVSSLSIICTLVVSSITILGTNADRVVAQVPSLAEQIPAGESTISQVNVLFVNPSAGNDSTGNGSEAAPLKTITQALKLANPGVVIKLAPGTYSEETGEMFPLMLKAGVSIQGDTANKGQGITIQGGGQFLSRSFGGQNVTIVGANQASLAGVTVTNTNPRGYGLWIESSNPVISENTFTGSTQDGISVMGNSGAKISKNYFYRNGANGITIGGTAAPQVRENIFQETGFGVNIAQNATPTVANNQIQNNRSGIIVQANARPILRNNLIQGSQEDGLVAIAQALPDLGNNTEAGGNEFRNNARYDINASAAKQVITAVGNTINNQRIAGNVAFNSQAAPVANRVLSTVPANGEITFTAPTVSNTNQQPSQTVVRNQGNSQLPSLVSGNTPLNIPEYNQKPPVPISQPEVEEIIPTTTVPVSSRNKLAPVPPVRTQPAQLNYVQVDTNTIEFAAPEAQQPQQTVTTTVGNSGILPVPSGNIPLGNTQNMPKVSAPQTNQAIYGNNYLSANADRNVRYRVVVETTSDSDQELVKVIAPGAFSTVWQGRRVMQVGVFSNRSNADEMLKMLNDRGLRSIVETLN